MSDPQTFLHLWAFGESQNFARQIAFGTFEATCGRTTAADAAAWHLAKPVGAAGQLLDCTSWLLRKACFWHRSTLVELTKPSVRCKCEQLAASGNGAS